jgi:multisubunit Na+/H+ antiporter MnhC subunit
VTSIWSTSVLQSSGSSTVVEGAEVEATVDGVVVAVVVTVVSVGMAVAATAVVEVEVVGADVQPTTSAVDASAARA